MEKTYAPHDIEQRLYKNWEAKGYFAPSGQGKPYCIMIPPPNVTGSLHMGHGFNNTIMDALIRYQRMQGKNTLWQVGTDHAGIATQMVVERQLAGEGLTRHDLGRDKFLEKVWEWKAESGGTITRQLRRLGSSVDWTRERFTMDDGLSKAVQEAFVQLYDDGLIYRGKRLVNWDPKLHTAISDLEVVSEEEKGSMWHFRYPLADAAQESASAAGDRTSGAAGTGYLVVATTRPETMLGDTAVAVNPNDERYQHLIGKTVLLPITNREIPVIADDYVDPEFGTGCVKITPAHDFNDYEVGKRHNLPLINVLDRDAKIVSEFTVLTFEGYAGVHGEKAPEAYAGMDRFEARKLIVAELETLGLVEKIDPHTLKVPRGDRSGVVIEPWLTDQWYVNAKELAKPAIKAVEDGAIKFVPQQYENLYFSWMRDIQDWCISRQLWWGHRIPAWYDNTQGNVYVGRDEAEVRSKYGLAAETELRQDEDVLDTWFSSALWTFSTLGWPEKTKELLTFHPTDVLVTGFDIIFFWVARMIMMTMHFMKHEDGTPQVPFRNVYVHGLVRDGEGQKMSKSKGNVLDPLDIIDGISLDELVAKRTSGLMQPQMAEKIEKRTRKEFPEGILSYGTDALRFTFASLATTGRDIKFDMGRVEGYRNFCNKIWNAANFVLMNTSDKDCGDKGSLAVNSMDQWILNRLLQVIAETRDALDNYRFDLAAQAIYEFTWNEFCDWYIELAKVSLQSEDGATQRGARRTLLTVLETVLRLSHPIMPFITEEIWLSVAPLLKINGSTIMLQGYPDKKDFRFEEIKMDIKSIDGVEWLKELILGVRRIRGEMDIKPGKPLPVLLQDVSEQDLAYLESNRIYLQKLARLESIACLQVGETAPESAIALVGQLKLLIPMAGLIDKEAELTRLDKEINRIANDLPRIEGKLNNPAFVDKAPTEVIEKEKVKLADLQAALTNLQTQQEKIKSL